MLVCHAAEGQPLTLVMTDVEGSTELWEWNHEAMLQVCSLLRCVEHLAKFSKRLMPRTVSFLIMTTNPMQSQMFSWDCRDKHCTIKFCASISDAFMVMRSPLKATHLSLHFMPRWMRWAGVQRLSRYGCDPCWSKTWLTFGSRHDIAQLLCNCCSTLQWVTSVFQAQQLTVSLEKTAGKG